MANSQKRTEPRHTLVRQKTIATIDGISLEHIFERMHVKPFKLDVTEELRIAETPKISWKTFSKKFGGQVMREWPECYRARVACRPNFFCANIAAQPYAPTAAGECGLILRFPTIGFQPEVHGPMFHAFSFHPSRRLLMYHGDYTWSHKRLEVNWDDLSSTVSVSKVCHLVLYLPNFECSARNCG